MEKYIVNGHLSIENTKGHLIGKGKKELLDKIKQNGSISAAAKEMKISYRHAWEMIKKMNSVAEKPLVIKNSGGTAGGGSSITEEGEMLMKMYDHLTVAFEEFKAQMTNSI